MLRSGIDKLAYNRREPHLLRFQGVIEAYIHRRGGLCDAPERDEIDAGFSEHLTKPVSFKKLHEVIQRIIGE